MIEAARFREVMASFPSGVVILTAFGDDRKPRGLTVSAFCAASLDPPLALVCIDKTSNTLPAVEHTGGFTANILAAGREQLARRMATKLSDKFDGIAWHQPESKIGGPILRDETAAYAVCTLRDTIEAGDHWILIGLVTEGDHARASSRWFSPAALTRDGLRPQGVARLLSRLGADHRGFRVTATATTGSSARGRQTARSAGW